jgi:hypothetical protein
MFPSSDEVGKLIGKSKIGLCFKQSEQWPLPSQTRLGRLTMAKRGVAAEFVTVPTRQGEITGLCPESSDFVDYAMGMLHSDWKHRAEEVFENYRSEMPMSDIMQSALDRTIVGIASTKWKSSMTAHRTAPEFESRISLRNLNAGGETGHSSANSSTGIPARSSLRDNSRAFFSRFTGMLHRTREKLGYSKKQ